MSSYRYQVLAAHDPHCVFQAECIAGEEAQLQGKDLSAEELVEWTEIFMGDGSVSCYCHTAENGHEGWEFYKPGQCKCGCGAAARSHYLPGHDARHASYVVRAYLESLETYSSVTLEQALAQLPTEALVAKADRRIAQALAARNA